MQNNISFFMTNTQPSADNVIMDDQDLDEVLDTNEPRPWFPIGDLKNLPTEIYSDCTLSRTEHQKILHGKPRNAEVNYKPPQMESYFLRAMSKQQKEFDKVIRNISYWTSAILCPIDNIKKALYESKPGDDDQEAKQGYELLRKSTQNARDLLWDALSYTNDLRREIALKAISSAHVPTKDRKGVFSDKFKDLVEEENTKSKLFNDANKERRRFYSSNKINSHKLTLLEGSRFRIIPDDQIGIASEVSIKQEKQNQIRKTFN
ncbi:5141_t:CDS:1 [Scutellospora calospora]|uniref:5141_t:CDS:1 n=1 Tax=Scutellospora calospora TaxID=85575 RepID=A0ACA9KEQ9_9GLOM|nr:5141_t:CDS:1 [Scutellospora calospora]